MDGITRQRLAQVADFMHGGALEQFIDGLVSARDAEWNRAIGYDVSGLVLSPEEAKEWLEKDRVQRARNVSEARVRRGPVRW